MINLASKARPYFGAVVLTCALLTAGGIYSATKMPSGVYPEVTFPRIAVVARVPDWAVTKMEAKVTRPRPVRRRRGRPDRPAGHRPAGRPGRGPAVRLPVTGQQPAANRPAGRGDGRLDPEGPAAAGAGRGRREGAAPGPIVVGRVRQA